MINDNKKLIAIITIALLIISTITLLIVLKPQKFQRKIIIAGMQNCNKTKLYHHIVDQQFPETVKSSQITQISLNPDIAPEEIAQIIDVPSDQRCRQNLQEIAKTATSILFLRKQGIEEAEAAKYLAELLNYKYDNKKVQFYVQSFEGDWRKQVIKQLEILTGNEDIDIIDQIQNIHVDFNDKDQLISIEKKIIRSE